MNSSDWTAATGHPLVGRGSRPINPRLLAGLTGKAAQPAWPAKKAAAVAERQRRRRIFLAALATVPSDPPKSAGTRRVLTEYEYWNNIDTARARSDRVKQRIWRPDLG